MYSSRHFISLILFIFFNTSYALDLELTQGVSSALPIGVSAFTGDDGLKIASIVNDDLQLSGQFKVSAELSPQKLTLTHGQWRGKGIDNVVQGSVTSMGNNKVSVHFELIDVVGNKPPLLNKTVTIDRQQLRSISHHIADLVHYKLTGERGVFSTRIAYILVKNNAGKKRYSLEVSDIDGYNPQSLLISSQPIMSPAWSPDAKHIAYVSFEQKKSQIYTVEVSTGKRRLVTDFKGINGAPSWSPDGKKMAVVLSKSGSPKIYEVSLNSGSIQPLTHGGAIDTEPRYSPDGKTILFTSGRGGAPQIYRLNLSNKQVSRVTYDGNYNARASYTPDQKNIVMLHRDDRKFNIGIQNSKNSKVTALTFARLDESPSVAPNGRLIIYATQYAHKGVLAMVSVDGRIRLRLPSREGDVQEPAWSPFLL